MSPRPEEFINLTEAGVIEVKSLGKNFITPESVTLLEQQAWQAHDEGQAELAQQLAWKSLFYKQHLGQLTPKDQQLLNDVKDVFAKAKDQINQDLRELGLDPDNIDIPMSWFIDRLVSSQETEPLEETIPQKSLETVEGGQTAEKSTSLHLITELISYTVDDEGQIIFTYGSFKELAQTVNETSQTVDEISNIAITARTRLKDKIKAVNGADMGHVAQVLYDNAKGRGKVWRDFYMTIINDPNFSIMTPNQFLRDVLYRFTQYEGPEELSATILSTDLENKIEVPTTGFPKNKIELHREVQWAVEFLIENIYKSEFPDLIWPLTETELKNCIWNNLWCSKTKRDPKRYRPLYRA